MEKKESESEVEDVSDTASVFRLSPDDSVCADPDMVSEMLLPFDARASLLGLYVYVGAKGWGRFSLPAMSVAVRASLGSRTDPRNCCDSGGIDKVNGVLLKA